MSGRHAAALFGSALLVFGVVTVGVIVALRVNPLHETVVAGAVIVDDKDPRRQMPIPNVKVVGTVGSHRATTISDPSGYFKLTFPGVLTIGRRISLSFVSAAYEPAQLDASSSNQLFIARLAPVRQATTAVPAAKKHKISNVRIRYTVQTESFPDAGTAVRTFVVENTANIGCRGQLPCSPDGQWEATTGGYTLDAGEHNHFRNVRASCIAGACPFTRIESEALSQNGQMLHVTALNWGDTATFLVEADVVHSQISDMVRQSFPFEFGEGVSFTLPPRAVGPVIEAELDGQDTYFPLGPDLYLTWATCTGTPNPDRSTLYSCELKPDYSFR